MNQHKDLLYRQKYATYQLNNRTFSTQNTKISARSLAHNQLHMFSGTYCKKKKKKREKKKPYYQLLRKIWWLPHPRPPTRALYAKLQLEKLQFLSLLTTILKALIIAENSRASAPAPRQGPYGGPLDPTRMRRIACFRHTHTIGLLAIIYNSFFSSFWSICKTFFRRKSTKKMARSISFFSSFLFSSQYNEQDHITSVTNTVMDILYRQTVIYQQCIYWDLRRIVCFQRRYI